MIESVDILDDARSMIEDSATERGEARRRAVVSRAYYAAYHRVQAAFPEIYRRSRGRRAGGMHRRFLMELHAAPDKDATEIARRLDMLYSQRLVADYRLDQTVALGEEADAVMDARAILDLAMSAPNEGRP